MTPPDELGHSRSRGENRNHRHYNHENQLDDQAIDYINKTLQSYGVTMNRKNSEDRYRSFGDLRRNESYRSRRASQIDVNYKPKVS